MGTLLTVMMVASGGRVVVAEHSWEPLPPLAAPRQEVGVAELDGAVYVIGGFSGIRTVNTVEVLRPGSSQWLAVAPLPHAVHHAGTLGLAGRVYVVGGSSGLAFRPTDRVFDYDPVADRWTELARLPTARGALALAAAAGRIYAIGGSPARAERDLAVYDPAANRWTQLPPMPTPRNHLAAATIGALVFAVGGRSGSIGGVTDALEAYDFRVGRWRRRAPMPTARGGLAAAAVGGCLYALGGEGNRDRPDGVFPDVEVYVVAEDRWRQSQPMALPRHGTGVVLAGNRLVVPGGGIKQGLGASSRTDALVLSDGPAVCGSGS